MKKMVTLVPFLFFAVGFSLAQTQIPEGGFNNWEPNSTNTYFEPAGGWWVTLNTLTALGAPVTVAPTTDAHSGAYAARLETKQWGTFLISGLLTSGNFIMVEPYIQNGRPFTDTPSKIKGWYKYSPVNGDSAGIGAILTKYNVGTGQKDTLGTAIRAITGEAQSYTQFEIDFQYNTPGVDPDTIIIVFTSSGDGGNFMGEVGSTLIIDDVMLEYTSGLLENLLPEFPIHVFPSPACDRLSLAFDTDHPEELKCLIYSIGGQLVHSFSCNEKNYQLDVSSWRQGKYIVQAFKYNHLVSTAKFLVNH